MALRDAHLRLPELREPGPGAVAQGLEQRLGLPCADHAQFRGLHHVLGQTLRRRAALAQHDEPHQRRPRHLLHFPSGQHEGFVDHRLGLYDAPGLLAGLEASKVVEDLLLTPPVRSHEGSQDDYRPQVLGELGRRLVPLEGLLHHLAQLHQPEDPHEEHRPEDPVQPRHARLRAQVVAVGAVAVLPRLLQDEADDCKDDEQEVIHIPQRVEVFLAVHSHLAHALYEEGEHEQHLDNLPRRVIARRPVRLLREHHGGVRDDEQQHRRREGAGANQDRQAAAPLLGCPHLGSCEDVAHLHDLL
mmetsp:Transcript_56390/g.164860  ORF Transcript_56390/g.164860 Transcript_56390/m.164860 type:complete len:301 (+) Transcript_56390:438-1340(+)